MNAEVLALWPELEWIENEELREATARTWELALERSPFRDDVDIVAEAPELDPYVVGLCCSKRNLKRPAVKAMWDLAQAL